MLAQSKSTLARSGLLSVLTCALCHVSSAIAQPDLEALRDQFVGVHNLAEYAPHGDEPTGRIWYAANGQMSAMLFPPGREPVANSAPAEEFREIMRGVVAYFGTYTIDPEAGTVTHHLEGASNPAWIGDDFVRWYRFDGDALTLSLNSEFRGTLFWRRIADD